jgi:hypothetical protein
MDSSTLWVMVLGAIAITGLVVAVVHILERREIYRRHDPRKSKRKK